MKHGSGLMVSLIVAVSLLLSFSPLYAKQKAAKTEPKATASKETSKDAAATVNGVAIKKSDVDSEMGRYERQMTLTGRTINPEQQKEVRKLVLDNLVNQELLSQETKKQGITVSDAEVNQQLEQLKKKFPGDKEFGDTLGRLKLTETDLKAQLAKDIAIKKLVDLEVANKINITPEETKAFYDQHPDLFKTPEQVRASHILIKVDPKATPEEKAKARSRIEEVQKKLKKGGDFAALAKEYSECPSSANGGDLDFFQKGQMVAPFDKAAFELKKGEISDIVETQFGYHLIKVTDKKPAGVMTYDEVKDRVAQHLKQEKVNQDMSKYIDKLKEKAKIVITAG
jgi:peptidyl-prolyl cis-trans isomerase C